jgi:hypothetical protein
VTPRWPATAILLLAGGCALIAQGEPTAPLAPVSAEYQVTRHGVPLARVEVQLELHPDGTYGYDSRTEPTGLVAWLREDDIRERSDGRWHAEGFTPERYSYAHRSSSTSREVEIRFDWPGMRAINTTGGTTWTMPVPEGTQDKLGQQLTLMTAMMRGLRNVNIQVADGGILKTYRYDVQGRERVQTPAGEFLAWRVRRRKDDQPSRLTLWSAPSLGYLPVRLDRRAGDDIYRMELVAASRPPVRGTRR